MLALKYRPRRFADVVGQKPTRALLARVCEKRELPASLIFSGVRGTGKTSVARLVAKSVNCAEPDRWEPCGECVSCVAVDRENALFVVEIDAASHGRVDDIRELVEDVAFSKGGAWQVMILDEAHSISREGWNALLKTLEEPPPRTTFVLVTTEPGRIPDTIHARSWHCRFTALTEGDILGRLRDVAAQEQIEYEQGALELIAEIARGGMRDALMMLDQASRFDVKVTRKLLEGVFGELSAKPLVEAMAMGRVAAAVLAAEELVSIAGDAGGVIDQAILLCRDVLLQRREVSWLTPGKSVEMLRDLWEMRYQVRQMAVDDRVALAALAAEVSRKSARSSTHETAAATEQELEEVFG